MNPNEQGSPSWTNPTGILPAASSTGCAFLQSPLFWLLAAGVVMYMMTQNESKESEND